jgi:hypothetical protein
MLRALLAGLLVLTPTLAVAAASVCVNPGGTDGCFATIQAAVDVASPGTVIDVAAGTYAESVVVPTAKRVTIRGAGAGATILQGDGVNPVINATTGTKLTVVGAALTGGRFGLLAGDRATIAVVDSDVSGNLDIGIVVTLKARGTVTGSTITANGQIGIEADGRLTLSSSTVSGKQHGRRDVRRRRLRNPGAADRRQHDPRQPRLGRKRLPGTEDP